MHDLEVIRLVAMDIIPKEKIPRTGMKVKRKFGGGRRECTSVPPDPPTGFSLVPRASFSGETPVPREECKNGGMPLTLNVSRA